MSAAWTCDPISPLEIPSLKITFHLLMKCWSQTYENSELCSVHFSLYILSQLWHLALYLSSFQLRTALRDKLPPKRSKGRLIGQFLITEGFRAILHNQNYPIIHFLFVSSEQERVTQSFAFAAKSRQSPKDLLPTSFLRASPWASYYYKMIHLVPVRSPPNPWSGLLSLNPCDNCFNLPHAALPFCLPSLN